MGKKRILTIGAELASDDAEYENFDSAASLLDWDIVLFKPDIESFVSYGDSFQGKPCLNDSTSFKVKECCEHWRREIKQAVDSGKTVIVFLSALTEIFVDTGERSYSGTGRNQKTTRHVAEYSNYQAIPVDLSPIISTGSAIKLSGTGADILATFWSEFGGVSHYQVILRDPKVPACLLTRSGNLAVGAIHRSKSSTGTLLLLPDIDFDQDGFTEEKDGVLAWTPKASQFASRLLAAVVALDKTLRSQSEVTPEPTWATSDEFTLGTEGSLRTQLLEAERAVEQAQMKKERIAEELLSAGAFRALLYEKGKPLERAIIEALRLIGFSAAPFKNSDSEFDVVFESREGRLIGEAEGKDNKAVNVDKARQLSMNIHEDLQRESVLEPAKPVLFGNGFRLEQPSKRGDPFTEKCHKAAASSSTALVATTDMFSVVRHLISSVDDEYARLCRRVLLSSIGRVTFPPLPATDSQDVTIDVKVGEGT